jgi:hypothetical protein
MKWAHLPVAGGLYDQHPDLLDGFKIIFGIRADYEAKEAEKRDKEMGKGQQRNKTSSRPSSRGRRR